MSRTHLLRPGFDKFACGRAAYYAGGGSTGVSTATERDVTCVSCRKFLGLSSPPKCKECPGCTELRGKLRVLERQVWDLTLNVADGTRPELP